MTMTLTTTALPQGGEIPRTYTCDGADRSPPLAWSGVPVGTRSLLLVCADPDAPGGVFHHWAAFDIPPQWTGLDEGCGSETVEAGFRQAVNDFNKPGYGGPCPPKGDRPHHYHFRLSALSEEIVAAGPGATCLEVQQLAQPAVLAFVELVDVYGR
jgi:hypothetical protein